MLSLFEQISNNRVIKSVRKTVRNSAPVRAVDAVVRFARSGEKLKGADEKIVSGLKGMGLITREEALALERRIVQLEARLNVLEHGGRIRARAERAQAAKPTKAAASKRTVGQASSEGEERRRTIRDAEANA